MADLKNIGNLSLSRAYPVATSYTGPFHLPAVHSEILDMNNVVIDHSSGDKMKSILEPRFDGAAARQGWRWKS